MANNTLYIVTSDISHGNHYLYTLCDLSVDGDWLYVAAGGDAGLFVLQAVR